MMVIEIYLDQLISRLTFFFLFTDPEASKWVDQIESTHDVWIHGFFSWDWSDRHVRVESINTTSKQVNIDANTPPCYNPSKNSRYYAYNILAELDSPGEYYLNRKTGVLYFYPPQDIVNSESYVSLFHSVITLQDTSYLTFSHLSIEGARGPGIEIFSSSNITVSSCTIINHGTLGVNITGGNNNLIDTCFIKNAGNGGVYLDAGDRITLTPSNHRVNNSDISVFNRWVKTYAPGVFSVGVGHTVYSNHIHEGPHQGIFVAGNDHLIEGNTISEMVQETADSGAFYMGRDWSYQGNIIRSNVWRNIHSIIPSDDVSAVYLDDSGSGFLVTENQFYNVSRGILLGGGRGNNILNNRFSHITGEATVHIDNRDMNWSSSFCQPGGLGEQFLKRVNYQSKYYAKYGKEFQNIMQDDPCRPKYNVISNNIYCDVSKFLDQSIETINSWGSTAANNTQRC
eukprot:TRINITY_DN8385_c0_g1_i4.p1 TRINITY_DN8385_c0_g1~~TRINITY_DN8385_c0_g1_i4.p1  ORF type:complete len:455 (+),score=52.53 TRINITY_DN8385_c0_g1_i4:653-2017(+)